MAHAAQVEGQAVGEARAHGGLTYLTIYNAGHMVRRRRDPIPCPHPPTCQAIRQAHGGTMLQLQAAAAAADLLLLVVVVQVPMDQPAVALAMLDDFLTGGAMTNPVAPIV